MGGAETYCRKLVEYFQSQDCSGLRIFLFVGRGHEFVLTNDAFEIVQLPVDPAKHMARIIFEQTVIPTVLESYNLDLVHFPYCTCPYLWGGKSVVTIHDSQRISLPQMLPHIEYHYRSVIEQSVAERGMHVIAVSNWDGNILRNDMQLPRANMSVIYYGIDEKFFDCAVNGQKKYLLWVGRPYPRKDVEVIIRAMGRLRKQGRAVLPFRVIGATPSYHERFKPVIEKAGVEDLVTLESYVPHEQLPTLYRDAAVFCYPSHYESFGIPVLEAMAAGVPVVSSDIPAFAEIAGGCALQCPIGDDTAYADAIARLLDDGALRQSQAERGRAWAQQFTWDRCASQTLSLYRSLAPSSI